MLKTLFIAKALVLDAILIKKALATSPPSTTPMQLDVCWGGIPCMTLNDITITSTNSMFLVAFFIGLAIFIVGAFMMVISGGNDTLLQSAKRAMKGSLIGVAFVAGAYGMYRTVVYIFYVL
ncbi:hypothetical protein HOF56_01560 [Candidatus Peribacteria bacterium]|jgi:hypothetical protein|nr:hypothetical protein [Candidatus Peribacteria bacterium]MBT4020778.1 hypothetical protein [Candidatus Peribacteria bacterium]MBT4241058.1 hypothetical protein [Candidatus Peribacteria bacterium]MBT4474443.1 hypothetical protein [Candidatus Peribacteria bacterium]